MRHLLTVSEIVAYLREQGQEAAALVVEGVDDSEKRCRKQMHDNLQAYYAIKAKYEPRPESPANYRSPPDADG
jgi:hypothetical protein